MGQVQFWQLVTDVLLTGALAYLCLRLVRAQRVGSILNARELAGLERSLRELIREAGEAGGSLNDRLGRRQQALEKLLHEIDDAEERIARPSPSQQGHRVQEPKLSARVAVSPQASARTTTPQQAPPPPRTPQQSAVARWRGVNIYGEPIGGPAEEAQEEAPRPQRAPRQAVAPTAATEVEPDALQVLAESADRLREVRANDRAVKSPPPAAPVQQHPAPREEVPSDQNAMQAVYESAERLLKTGRSLEIVSRETRIPIEEVRMLSQILIQEEQARELIGAPLVEPSAVREQVKIERDQTVPTELNRTVGKPAVVDPEIDPRLGVLAPIRRHVQTL